MTTLQNRTTVYNTTTLCNCSKLSFSDIRPHHILEHDFPFQSLEQPKPLYFSNNYDSCDRCDYFQDDPIDKRYGCPISQFIDDVYSQFVLKNPDKPTIIDFMESSDYLSSIPHTDKQWLSIQQHLSKYTRTISKPIHSNIFDLIEYESSHKHLMHKYENTQDRILHYTSQIAPTYLRNLAKTFDPKTPHQLDVFFIPKIVHEINSNYFKKHKIRNFVRCKWTQQQSISIVEYGEKTCFAGYGQRKPDMLQEISSMYLLLRQLYQTHKSKRYVMLIMSKDIHNISMDEICIFEPPKYNTLPPYPKHIYNELQWIYNTKQPLPDIPWDTLHALCISFHEHEDAERVYFSTMLPNNSYHSIRLFKSNILDVLTPFCKDRTDKMPDWYHEWLEFKDPQYIRFVETYFSDLKLFDEIEPKEPPVHDEENVESQQQNTINEAMSQKTMDEYNQINSLIDEYYKSLNVEYNDQFIQYIFDNEFEDVPLEDNLGSDIDPKDCTLLHFDHLFAIHPNFNINNEEELHEYIFYFLQHSWINGKFPSPQYMSKKVPSLLCDDHTSIQGTVDEIIAINEFAKIAKNIITNPTQTHKVDLDDKEIIKQFTKIDKLISLLHSSGFSNFSDDTNEYNHVYTFDAKNENSWNKFEKAVNQLHDNINVLSSDYLMTCIYYTMCQNQPNIISVFAGNKGTATSNSGSTGGGNSNDGCSDNQQSTNRNDTGQNNNNNNHTNNNNSGDDGKDNDNNRKNKPHKANTGKKKKKRKKKKNNNNKEMEAAVDELYQYMDKTQALQHGKDEFDTKNEKIKIINYDFHEKKTEIPLYCVAKTSNDRGYKWKLENRMFTANDLFKEYGISKNEIPRTLRAQFLTGENISASIKKIMEDEKQIIHKINKMSWHKVPVFKKSNNSLMMRLEMSKKEFIDNIIQFIKDKNNKNNTLIPILMFNNNSNQCYIDYVWIIKLPKVNVNIGVSLNYNQKTGNIEPTAIHLDKQSILRQHKLAYPSHECHCLDNFKKAEIPLDLAISSQYINEQHTNASKNLLQELLSANFEINNEWKQKVLNLLNNNDKIKHNTSYDPPSENRADGIIQIPRRFRRNIITKIKELFGPLPKTHPQPARNANSVDIMTNKLQTKNVPIDPKSSIQQTNIPMNNTQNVSINSKVINNTITPQPTIGNTNYNPGVSQQPNITPFAPPNLGSIPMQPIQKTTPGFNITPYYPVTMLMPAIPNTINVTGQSLNPSTYTKYYPPILMPCSYIPINNQYPRFPVLYPPILLNTVQ